MKGLDWDFKYTGHNFSNITIGNPLIQYQTFNWDEKNLHEALGVNDAMVSNWEYAFLTKETINLCHDHIRSAKSIYPNRDLIQLFPGYMALKSGQLWKFPPFFGTFDPSNRINHHNHLITTNQIDLKYSAGYTSVKRVNYSQKKRSC